VADRSPRPREHGVTSRGTRRRAPGPGLGPRASGLGPRPE